MAQGNKPGTSSKQRGVPQKIVQQMQDELYEFILMGYPRNEILEYFELNYNLKTDTIIGMYNSAHSKLLEFGEFDTERIITQHIAYYEEAMRYFDSVGDFIAKSQAMNAKEKLLKLFEEDEQTIIDVDTHININIEQLDYDMDKLSATEQEEFQQLFSKVRKLKS